MEYIELPQNLTMAIGSENRDFAVKAGRLSPVRKSLHSIFFGLAWTGFVIFFISLVFNPEATDPESAENTSTIPFFMYIFLGIFLLIGLSVLASGIIQIFKKGGIFVGTPQRLIQYRNGRIRSIDWEQFTGDLEVGGNEQKGNIEMRLRSGHMVNRKGGNSYVPDLIYISGIPDVFEIERICRRRIKENDPTPPSR